MWKVQLILFTAPLKKQDFYMMKVLIKMEVQALMYSQSGKRAVFIWNMQKN